MEHKRACFNKHATKKIGRLLENVQRLGARAGEAGGVQYGYVEDLDGSGNNAYEHFVTASSSVVMSFMVRCTLEVNGCFRVLTRNVSNGEERHFTCLEDAVNYMQKQMRAAQAEMAP